jgi:organic radical activating enzyme
MKSKLEQLRDFKKELDEISPTFCVAKWKQVTMHLESGLTHSCHHPKAHTVPLDELDNNFTALHNTNYKKSMRKAMLNGEIVPECEYCNRVERNSSGTGKGSSYSDRVFKSHDDWAKKYIPEILSNPPDYNVFPSYFEVSFSSACNCSCIYCSSTFSTGWQNEINKFGPYDHLSISTRSFKQDPPPMYPKSNENPYVKAFWKWWPELCEKLEYFRITGGEPLLSKDTFKILDSLIEKPKPQLKLEINSNLCVNDKIIDKFIKKAKEIAKNQTIKVYTSCESHNEKAEYIRPGLNYKKWFENCRLFLTEVPNTQLNLMCTYNILSVTSFTDYLKDVLKLKKEFPQHVHIDIPILMNPPYLQANVLTNDFIEYVKDSINFMYGAVDIEYWPPLCGNGFYEWEITKLIRIFNQFSGRPEHKGLIQQRIDFKKFIDEHDRRYAKNFLEIFPEYTDFYKYCGSQKI